MPSHAQSRVTADNHPNRRPRTQPHSGGLVHDNTRHTTRFTVVGNHLAQHPELSLLAIGLGVHIQSLPKGARVDIKSLAARFTEGATRIAAALRELEAHGYLRRQRERVSGGLIVTRTISCNQPATRHHDNAPARSTPVRQTAASVAPQTHEAHEAHEAHETRAEPEKPQKRTHRKPLSAVPQPAYSSPTLLKTATDLLAELRRYDPRLLLSACDAAHLAPGVAAWLERDVAPTAVRHALTADLPPEPLRRPAAILAHRLTAQLPPPPPFRAPAPPPAVIHTMQNCDGCDRGFRAPQPGRCRDCRKLRQHATSPA